MVRVICQGGRGECRGQTKRETRGGRGSEGCRRGRPGRDGRQQQGRRY